MRLKSLTLFGFKSFATKTELIFSSGITAVVGPNGSGKSNILDAIIWVLGERSTKALRSLKAADLLFAGNGKVKPASIAEVSLTLELNEAFESGDGSQSPIVRPYELISEIVITRRLKRTGESQFAINRVPCRLRDVQDLLLELGLSADSYAFIGQAEIDRLVFLSPQERRELIEQVAGVHRFQIRREDALANLERTEKNLTRIRDLVAELLKQRDALSGDVEKARKYEQLLKRQRELNIALLGWEHQVRLKRVERLKEELETLKQTVAETDEQIAVTNAQRAEVDGMIAQMEEGFQQLQTSAAQALEEAKSLENELALCRERQKHLTQRRTQIAQQKTYIAERSNRLKSELEESQKQLDAIKHQKSLFEEQEHQMQEAMKKAQEFVAELEQTVEQARDEHFEIERSLAESRSQIASYEPLLQSLRLRQTEVERERSNVRELLLQLQQEQEKLVSQHQAVATEELDKIVRQLQQQINEKRNKALSLRHQLVQGREQLAAMKARLAALEEMELSMAGIPQGARAVLIAARDGRLQGKFHLLAQIIRVPEGLEIAYESALGAAANYLAVANFAEVQSAIEFLKATNAGRATFIALDFLAELGYSEEKELAKVEAEGVIGWASELVQLVDEKFASAVRHVLRNTLLVENLETARQLALKLKGVRFVTRSGEVVAPTGTISGGSTVQGAGSLFLRQREREELSSRVRSLETQVRELETQLQSTEAEIENLQSELTSTMQKREEQKRVSERLSEDVRRIAAERERRQKEMERLDAEAVRLQKEIESLQNEMETVRQKIVQLERKRENAQRILNEAQTKLSEAIQQREAINQQWQQFKLVATQWQTQFENLQRRVSELTEGLDELARQEEALRQEEQTIESELQELDERLPEIEHQLEECRKRREQIELALSNWHEERKRLMQKREEIEQRLANLSSQKTAQTEEVHRCEVRLTQAEAERTEIERRLIEEYQVAIEDAHAAAQRLEQKQIALDELERIKQEMAALGEVRLSVLDEYQRLNERINFLQTQIADLESARNELLSGLEALERQFRERFKEILERVSETFNEMVQRFWQGGEGRLILTEGQTLAESGVEVKVKLPGKAEQDLLSLSGGEKAIVGLCFLFALLKINPAPFVLLDEVDAPLDDANTDRFVSLLKEFSDRTQFIVITHNPITVQAADNLYGVTMEEEGISKVLSLSLKEALEWAEQP
ncbi:MAG: chromosome segregation protein SMC [Armatimonadetes bacterium]|nr:chromosome segregation protein SMC [Armatimonadota bacterium]MDW8027080.1 chromosome segregation protein SMC [Armatimonadota bacterium]